MTNVFWLGIGLLALWIIWNILKAIFYDVPKQMFEEAKQERAVGGQWIPEAVVAIGFPFGAVWILGFFGRKWGLFDRETIGWMDGTGLVWFFALGTGMLGLLGRWLRGNYRSIPSTVVSGIRSLPNTIQMVIRTPAVAAAEQRRLIQAEWTAGHFAAVETLGLGLLLVGSISLYLLLIIALVVIAVIVIS